MTGDGGGVGTTGDGRGAEGAGTGGAAASTLVLGVDWAPAGALDMLVPEVLSREEIAAGLRLADPAARAARLAGRALLLAVAARELGVPSDELPPLTRECEHCGGPHGRPRLREAHVSISLSRASGLVVVGWARTTDEVPAPAVGLDVVDPRGRAPLPRVVLHPRERARGVGSGTGTDDEDHLWQAWARKEAVLKASGHGLLVEPARLDLGLGRSDRRIGGRTRVGTSVRWAPVPTGGWNGTVVTDLRVGPLHGALAVDRGWSPPPQLDVRRWPA